MALVRASAAQLLERDGCIRKISAVQRHIEASSGAELKPWFVGRVMRRLLDLRYSKVRKVPFQANFERCLVLRHLYAKKTFELMQTDARFFTIDESWINDLSWNQRQWHVHGARNSATSLRSHCRPEVFVIATCIENGDIRLPEPVPNVTPGRETRMIPPNFPAASFGNRRFSSRKVIGMLPGADPPV